MTTPHAGESAAVAPRFSVVMPAFNAERTIAQSIGSVVTQTCADWELIVVDDGSSDATPQIVESIGDSRVRLLRQPASGLPAAARNRGIREARGRYVAFVDADDVLYAEKLERVSDYLTARPSTDVVCHDVVVVVAGVPRRRRAYRSDGSDFYEQLVYRGNFLSTSAVTVRRTALLEAGLFPEARGEPMAEDYALWLRLAERGCSFVIVPEVLGEYHRHDHNLSGDLERMYAATLRGMQARFRALADRGRLDKRRALVRLTRTRGALVRDAAWARNYRLAFKATLRLPFELASDQAAYRSPRGTHHIGIDASTIVLVNNFRGPGLGGGETQLLQLIRGCNAAGMGVRLLHAENAELEAGALRAGAAVQRLPLEPGGAVATAMRLRRCLVESSASIVQGTGFYTNMLCRIAAFGLPVRAVNAVHVVPGASLLDGGSRLDAGARELVDRATRRRVAAYVAVSAAVKEGLVAQGVSPDLVTIIHNGIDADAVRAAAAAPAAAAPAAAGSPRARPLVGVVARLEPVKGVEVFVRAVAGLLDDHPHAGFVVVGAGSQEQALRGLAESLGLRDRISWLGNVSAVAPLLADLDIVVLPSLSEGLPMVALEAMSLGRPIVATKVGGIPEIVVDGATGVLVPPGDHRALAAAIGALLSDTERARAMGHAGQDRVRRSFTVENMVAGYLALYARLLS